MKNTSQTIVAVAIMFAFLFFWETFVASRYSHPKITATPVSREAAPAVPAATPTLPASPASTHGSAPADAADTLTVLENDQVKASFLSRGARVASWQVKERDHWIELLVPEKTRVTSPLETFPDINFAVREKSDQRIVYQATLPDGIVVTKIITLFAQPPFHTLSISFSNPTASDQTVSATLPWGNGIDKHVVGTPYDNKAESVATAEMRVVGLTNVLKSWKPGFIFHRTVDMTDPSSFSWVGVDNNHFLAALIGDGANIDGVNVVADRVHPPLVSIPLRAALKPGAVATYSYKLYVGPKSYGALKKLPYGLEKAVNFGFFGPIAKVLLATLNFFKSITHNYGWAIVLLTFCIQLLMFPLTRKNLQMSLKMRTLQPQLKKIQEQFKKDPKRLQIETFNLYRKNGMKFMGMEGCFPMLLQLPLFYAFYSTLNVAYELRGAPWIFWIKDLGTYDPHYVLPVLMGVGMLAQQKFTTVSMDPQQARMMMFMPLVFSFMFIHLPAGLVLYWCINSLTTIGIQLFLGIHKQQPPAPQTT
jgi:YidC/Oxa1 family membrane protein insertase